MALENRDGKHSDSKIPTVVDWARNCPVAYAEKIKYDELNLPMWVCAFVSEILSSRTGMSPALPTGELEARLQHLLCVLQVTLVNSEKKDFTAVDLLGLCATTLGNHTSSLHRTAISQVSQVSH